MEFERKTVDGIHFDLTGPGIPANILISLEVLAEDTSIESGLGDASTPELVRKVRIDLDRGNPLAWCGVAITAKLKDSPAIQGADSIWGVSYLEGFECLDPIAAFLADYGADMVAGAIEDLTFNCKSAHAALESFFGGLGL